MGIYTLVLFGCIQQGTTPKLKSNFVIYVIISFLTYSFLKLFFNENSTFFDLKNIFTLFFIFITSSIIVIPRIFNQAYIKNIKKSPTIYFVTFLNVIITLSDTSGLTNVGAVFGSANDYRSIGLFGGTAYGGLAAGILGIYCIIYSNSRHKKIFWLLLSLISISMTGSRGSLMAFLIIAATIIEMSKLSKLIGLIAVVAVIYILAGSSQSLNNILLLAKIDYNGLFSLNLTGFNSINDFTSDRLDYLFSDGAAGSAKKRFGLLYFAFVSIMTGQNLLSVTLWGYGLHNTFLTIWVVLGSVAFVLFLYPFIKFCIYFFQNKTKHHLAPIEKFMIFSFIQLFFHIFLMDDIGNRFMWSLLLPSAGFVLRKRHYG